MIDIDSSESTAWITMSTNRPSHLHKAPQSPPDLAQLLATNGVASTTTARLQSLFTFTSQQKLTNLTGYEANVTWWTQVIDIVIREGWLTPGDVAGDRLSVHVDDGLVRRLAWPGVGQPKGLGSVIKSMATRSPASLVPMTTFLSQPSPIRSTPSLAYRFVARPLLYTLSLVNPFSSSSTSPDAVGYVEAEASLWNTVSNSGRGVSYAHIPLIEDAAARMIAWWEVNPPTVYSERLFSVEGFQVLASRTVLEGSQDEGSLSMSDCKVLLRYLQRDKGVLVGDASSEIYKLVESSSKSESITEADRGTVTITSTILKLQRQIAAVEAEIELAKQKAASYIRQKQQSAAISYLRSKKQLESVLDKRLAAMEQLNVVLRSIDGAHSDIEVMQAYESSTSTLKSVLAHSSLQRDKVDSTLDALAQALSDQQELDSAIRTGQDIAVDAAGVSVDDDELEKELAGLVAENGASEREDTTDAGRREQRMTEELDRLRSADGPLPNGRSLTERTDRISSRVFV